MDVPASEHSVPTEQRSQVAVFVESSWTLMYSALQKQSRLLLDARFEDECTSGQDRQASPVLLFAVGLYVPAPHLMLSPAVHCANEIETLL